MAEIFPQCRRDYPLPPPINRGGFDGLEEEKIESKISQKISFSPVFLPANVLSSLSLSLSLSLQLLLQPLKTPQKHSSSTNRRRLSLPTNPNPLCRFSSSASFSFFLRHKQPTLPPFLPRPPAPPQVVNTTTNRPLSSHRDSFSLLHPTFLSPLQTSSSCAVATPAAKLSINAATSTTTGPYRLRWFSVPVAHYCCHCMQNEFCIQRPK